MVSKMDNPDMWCDIENATGLWSTKIAKIAENDIFL